MLINQKQVQRRGTGEKCRFFSLQAGRHKRIKLKGPLAAAGARMVQKPFR